MAGYEPLVRERVGVLIDSFVGESKAADFVARFAKRLPGQVFTAIAGALETTVSGLTSIVVFLDRFPAVRAQLVADPALARHAVQEVLRMVPPAHCPARTVVRDVELDGVTSKAGDRVLSGSGPAIRNGGIIRRHSG